MNLTSLRTAAFLLAILPICEPPARAPEAHDSRVRRIEERLLPSVPLESDSDSGWSIADRLRAHQVPGMSVAFIHDGRVAWTREYGIRDSQLGAPVTPTTLFQAGSISKPVAALVALQLVAAGRVALDTNVNRYLQAWHVPDNAFTRTAPVTLRRLLTHQAGVNVRGFDGYRRGTPVPTLLEVIRGTGPANSPAVNVDTTPGSINRYSGGGFVVVQQLIEEVTGERFDRVAQSQVFRPLGLPRSTYGRVVDSTNRGDIAIGHATDGVPIEGGWRDLPEMTAASLWSTPSELAQLIIAMQQAAREGDSRILSPALVREMMSLNGPNQGLGIGLKGEPPYRFSHSGSNDGFRAMFIGYLDRAEGVVVMTNGDKGDALAMEYIRSIAREYGWQDLAPRVRRTIKLTPAQRAGLVGRYHLGPNWEIEVIERNGQLLGGPVGRPPLPLHAETDSTLFYTAIEHMDLAIAARDSGRVREIVWRVGERRVRGIRVAPPTVLSDVTLIDGTGTPPQPNVDIVISGGRIAAVSPHGRGQPPAGSTVLNLAGKFVMPGLIDAHVHLATYDREPSMQDALLRAALLGGVTTVRDMGGNIDQLQGIARRARGDSMATSRFIYSAVMSGPNSMWFTDARREYAAGRYALGQSPGVRMVDSTTPLRTVIAQAKATGASGIKLYGDLPPALLASLSAEAHRQGLAVWSHLSIGPGRPSDVLNAGVDVVSHANMFINELLPPEVTPDSAFQRRRAAAYASTTAAHPTMQRLLAMMRARGTALDATLHIMDPSRQGSPSQTPDSNTPHLRFAAQMTRAAFAAGIPVLVGSDEIGRGTPNVHHELQELTDRVGLTPLQAIHAATLANARALGVADSLGSVAVGKLADLVVLDGDPSRDVANTLTVERVFRGGVMHRRARPLEVLPYLRAPRAR